MEQEGRTWMRTGASRQQDRRRDGRPPHAVLAPPRPSRLPRNHVPTFEVVPVRPRGFAIKCVWPDQVADYAGRDGFWVRVAQHVTPFRSPGAAERWLAEHEGLRLDGRQVRRRRKR